MSASTKRKKVAIFGATSHLAKSLLFHFEQESNDCAFDLYTRRAEIAKAFLDQYAPRLGRSARVIEGYEAFPDFDYDVILNCVGIGPLSKHQVAYFRYFTVYEAFDNLALQYLENHQDCTYLAFGSGAVYVTDFTMPAGADTANCIRVNQIAPDSYYSISRLYAESKHRAFSRYRIVDLRIFSFFSRFYDPLDGYLVNQMIEAVRLNQPFVTDSSDFSRDFLDPRDLYQAVAAIIEGSDAFCNGAFDLCSAKPLRKSELISYFSSAHGMTVETSNTAPPSATGKKDNYFSTYRQPCPIGNVTPRFSSMEAVAHEAMHVLALAPSAPTA